MDNGWRVLVADDEPLALTALRKYLRRHQEVGEIREARDTRETARQLRTWQPDLVFLDVQMPGGEGFEALAEIGACPSPALVFVTAHETYAVRAFEVEAVDYLLKPFSEERFELSLERALRKLASAPNREDQGHLERIACRTGERTTWVDVSEIIWIEAASSYVRLHTPGRTHLLRTGIGALTARLDPHRFVRIHRSAVVQVAQISEVVGLDHGDGFVTLKHGQQLRFSRRRRPAVLRALRGRKRP